MPENHPLIRQPQDLDAFLWRYMDLAEFVDLLQRSCLFFSRSDLLGEPFEESAKSAWYRLSMHGTDFLPTFCSFLVSFMRRRESWRDWLVLKFSTRRRSLPYTSSEKRSALATSWGSMSVPARISITETASLGTTWHRADALVVNREGFWKSVYERSRNGKECFAGSQS